MTALQLEAPQTRSRPSTVMNAIEGDTMLEELREQEAKIVNLLAQLKIANKLAADLRLHLLLAEKL